jgi:cbb3-type cytochrome oxidase maturation protein
VNSIFFLLPIALLLGGIFAVLFVKAARDGQFEDLDDPPKRMLQD